MQNQFCVAHARYPMKLELCNIMESYIIDWLLSVKHVFVTDWLVRSTTGPQFGDKVSFISLRAMSVDRRFGVLYSFSRLYLCGSSTAGFVNLRKLHYELFLIVDLMAVCECVCE